MRFARRASERSGRVARHGAVLVEKVQTLVAAHSVDEGNAGVLDALIESWIDNERAARIRESSRRRAALESDISSLLSELARLDEQAASAHRTDDPRLPSPFNSKGFAK